MEAVLTRTLGKVDIKYADDAVQKVGELFNKLPKTGKPTGEEWTVVAGVVQDCGGELQVVSLGTGSKCVSRSALSPTGDVLHDAHAEVVARRGFIIYLMDQVSKWHSGKSAVFSKLEDDKLTLLADVRFCLVTTTVPCGDAAIMPFHDANLGEVGSKRAAASAVDELDSLECKRPKWSGSDIHRTGAKCLPHAAIQDLRLPGADYHVTGQVRTKPGRGERTSSVSCSDKLARWNGVGIQGALLALLIHPVHIHLLIVAGETPFCAESLERAINKRIGQPGKITFIQSRVNLGDMTLKSRQRHGDGVNSRLGRPAPGSIAWNITDNEVQVSVEGRRLGATKAKPQRSPLAISRKCIFKRFTDLIKELNALPKGLHFSDISALNYRSVKNLSTSYKEAWCELKRNNFITWTDKPAGLDTFQIMA